MCFLEFAKKNIQVDFGGFYTNDDKIKGVELQDTSLYL